MLIAIPLVLACSDRVADDRKLQVNIIYMQCSRRVGQMSIIVGIVFTASVGNEVIRHDVHVTGSTNCHDNRKLRSSSSSTNTANSRCSSRDVYTHAHTQACLQQ